jgi:hypothetical protein
VWVLDDVKKIDLDSIACNCSVMPSHASKNHLRTIWVLALVFASCSGNEPPAKREPATDPPPEDSAVPESPIEPALAENFPTPEEEPLCSDSTSLLNTLQHETIKEARVISARSLSLKLRLAADTWAAWKPMLRKYRRALNEVAAYRLSRFLGVCEVPQTVVRSFPLNELLSFVTPKDPLFAAALSRDALRNETGAATGAAIAWIEDIDPKGLEERGHRSFLSQLLHRTGQGSASGDEASLAAQYSRMLVFDHVFGNWDRFSGGNLFLSRDGKRLVPIDHNNSLAPWSARQNKRMQGQLESLSLFDRTQIETLRTMTLEKIATIIGNDLGLGNDTFLLVLERSRQVLDRISRLLDSGADPYLP